MHDIRTHTHAHTHTHTHTRTYTYTHTHTHTHTYTHTHIIGHLSQWWRSEWLGCTRGCAPLYRRSGCARYLPLQHCQRLFFLSCSLSLPPSLPPSLLPSSLRSQRRLSRNSDSAAKCQRQSRLKISSGVTRYARDLPQRHSVLPLA